MSIPLSKEELARINGRFIDEFDGEEEAIFARAEANGQIVRVEAQGISARTFVFVPQTE
jgi:hypothetical protein